jgi:hypothetical protein
MPPKKKKAGKKGSSKEPKKSKKDKSPKKGGKSKSPSKGKGGKGKKGKGKENKPESDSEEEEPPPPTERELWLADGGILPQMTCGAEDLLRYELLKHDERELSSTIEERPQFASCNGYSLNWLPDVNQKWRPTPNPQNPLLKSDKLPRLGKSHEPDRKGVERCWLLLRSHFEPIEPPPTIDEAEEKRKQEVAEAVTLIHRFVRRFCHVKMAVDAFLKPPPLEAPKSPVSDAGPSDAFVLPLEDKHKLLAPRKASLRGFYDFLESSGEKFEGGYPYDDAKWRPLQLSITVWKATSELGYPRVDGVETPRHRTDVATEARRVDGAGREWRQPRVEAWMESHAIEQTRVRGQRDFRTG